MSQSAPQAKFYAFRTVGQSTSSAARTHGSLTRGGVPFAPGRQRHHRVHIGARAGADRDRISVQARHHRRIHGIGRAKARRTETVRPCRSARGNRSRVASMRCTFAGSLRRQIALDHRPPHIHRQMPAQRQKAGMHFVGDGARMRPRRGIRRPQSRAWGISPPDIPGSRAIPTRARRRRSAPAPCRCRNTAPTAALKLAASSEITVSSNAMPATFMAIHGRIDQDE